MTQIAGAIFCHKSQPSIEEYDTVINLVYIKCPFLNNSSPARQYLKKILQQRMAYKRGTSGWRSVKGTRMIVKSVFPEVRMDGVMPTEEELKDFEFANNQLRSK